MKKLMFALLMPLFLASSAFGTDEKGVIWNTSAVNFDTTRNLMVAPFPPIEVGKLGANPRNWYGILGGGNISISVQNVSATECFAKNADDPDIFLSGAQAGHYTMDLYDAAGVKTKTFSHQVKVGGALLKDGFALNLYLAAADNLTRNITAPTYAVEISEANYSGGQELQRVELTVSGAFDNTNICLCYGTGFDSCSVPQGNGGPQAMGGGGRVKLVLPFKIEDIPDA